MCCSLFWILVLCLQSSWQNILRLQLALLHFFIFLLCVLSFFFSWVPLFVAQSLQFSWCFITYLRFFFFPPTCPGLGAEPRPLSLIYSFKLGMNEVQILVALIILESSIDFGNIFNLIIWESSLDFGHVFTLIILESSWNFGHVFTLLIFGSSPDRGRLLTFLILGQVQILVTYSPFLSRSQV